MSAQGTGRRSLRGEVDTRRAALQPLIAADLASFDAPYSALESIVAAGEVPITNLRGLSPAVVDMVVGLIGKQCKTARAIRATAVEGCGDDALVIVRSLFETTMAQLWLLQTDSRRRLRLYTAHGIYRHLIQLEALKKTPGQKRAVSNETVAEFRRMLDGHAARLGAKTVTSLRQHWGGPEGLKGVATKLGRRRGWLRVYNTLYRVSSFHAHAGDGHHHYQPGASADEGTIVDLYPSEKGVASALFLAALLLLASAERIDERLGLGRGQEFRELRSQLTAPRASHSRVVV